MKIRDARSLPSVAQEDLRSKVIRAVRNGKKQVEVAQLFGVTRQAVGKWVKKYREGGHRALRAQRRGRRRGLTLQPWQAAQIARTVINRYPAQLKLPFYLWTRQAVAEFIKQRFKIDLSTWTVGRYLGRWGFTPQKPTRQASEQDPVQVRKCLEERYPMIQKRARKRHAYIVFIDESGFMLNPLVRRTWVPRGQTPVIKVSEPHGRISVIGAITISPERRHFGFYFHLLEDNANFHGNSVVQFIEDVHQKTRGPITLLWDAIPIHRARPVESYLAKHPTIVVEPFPPYAPELNPVDNVWSYVKYDRLPNYTLLDLRGLRRHITTEFCRLKQRPDLLESFFKRTGLTLDPR